MKLHWITPRKWPIFSLPHHSRGLIELVKRDLGLCCSQKSSGLKVTGSEFCQSKEGLEKQGLK